MVQPMVTLIKPGWWLPVQEANIQKTEQIISPLFHFTHISIGYFNIQVFAMTLLAIGDQVRAEDTKLKQTYYIWF